MAIRDSVTEREYPLTREVVGHRLVRWSWVVAQIPHCDGIAVDMEDVIRALREATRAWAKCNVLAREDTVERQGWSQGLERNRGRIDWQYLERIRNSSYALKTAKAVASFTPVLLDSATFSSCIITVARDPLVPYSNFGKREFRPDRPARWIVRHQRDQEAPPYLMFDEMLMHEYGHTLGLSDIDRPGAVMDSVLNDPQRPSQPLPCECNYLRRMLPK